MSFEFDIEDKPEKYGFEKVAQFDPSSGYDWSECRIWKHIEDDRLFWHADSGCSCNYFGQDIGSVADLTVLNATTLIDLEKWVDDQDYTASLEERMAFKKQAGDLLNATR